MPRPIILTFVGCYLPGYKSGGQGRSISNLVERLGDELDFHIFTADRDMLDTKPYPNVVIDGWNTVGKAKVFYASPGNRSLRSLARFINETPHDILYLNSFFSPIFTIRPLLVRYFGMIPKRPTVVAPHGEFSKGALALKWLKKKIYLFLVRRIKLYKGIVWQASSEYEKQDIFFAFGKADSEQFYPVRITPNLTSSSIMITPNSPKVNLLNGERYSFNKIPDFARIVFISRISRKKNLDYALRILREIRGEVKFDIYGPLEDGKYWRECKSIIAGLPPNVQVIYKGEIDPRRVVEVFSRYHLFFFPTRGENYGNVILESLCGGCPVLISDQTPWRDLHEKWVGWDIPLSEPLRFQSALKDIISMDYPTFQLWSSSAMRYGDNIINEPFPLNSNRELFYGLLGP